MTAPKTAEAVCGGCNRLHDVASGRVVSGWERARFVSTTDYLCPPCKEPVINSLSRALAATL